MQQFLIKTGTAALVLAGLCAGGAPAYAGDEQEIHVNDAALEIWLWTDANVSPPKYVWSVMAQVQGTKPIGSMDTVNVDWKQNGKVLASQRCPLKQEDKRPNVGLVDCKYDRNAKVDLRAYGDVDATLTYINEVTDKQIPLRTLHLKVARYWDWTGNEGKKVKHAPVYQILGDDLLGSSLMWLPQAELLDSPGPYEQVAFYFWAARRKSDWPKSQFRCSVDGKRIEKELNGTNEGSWAWLSTETDDRLVAEDRQYLNGKSPDPTHFAWANFSARPRLVYKTTRWKAGDKPNENDTVISEHPGQWVCEIRSDGKPIREFRFTVEKDGQVAMHPEQTGGDLWFPTGWRIVETRFPAPDTDFSLQPDVIKKHGFFGAPWKHPEAWKGMFDALPKKAVGSSEVKPPPGVK